MSKLVILEGFLAQILKNKDKNEVYAVLSTTSLKIYQSQVAYKQNPDTPCRLLEFANHYNVIPMNSQMFSIFKRGEKADERLYLEASNKTDYDLWMGHIDTILNKKPELSTRGAPAAANAEPVKAKTAFANTTTASVLDSPTNAKASTPRFNIRTGDDKQLQQGRDKLEADLRKEKQNVIDAAAVNDELQRKLKLAELKISELENEKKKLLSNLEKNKNDNHSFSDSQLTKASNRICQAIQATHPNNSSYEFLVSYLCADHSQATLLHSFLGHQLEYLIHRSVFDTASDQSLFQYLTNSIHMSEDIVAKFLSTFLLSLTKQTNPTPITKVDLITNLNSVILSVVQTRPSHPVLMSNKPFQQTAIEIAYLLAPKCQEQSHLANGYSETVCVTEQFTDLAKCRNVDPASKTFFIELCNHIDEELRIRTSVHKAPLENNTEKENLVSKHFDGRWNELHVQLTKKDQEVNDLLIALSQVSARIEDLERERITHREIGCIDSYINYFISVSESLCSTCQLNISAKLNQPISSMTDKLAEDFSSYWKCVSDLATVLARKKTGTSSDLKDSIDMAKKCAHNFESLVTQFQDISRRTIKKPTTSLTNLSTNDL